MMQKAIDIVFDKLALIEDQIDADPQDDEAIVNAMHNSELNIDRSREKRNKVGQIVVEIERVCLGKSRLESEHHHDRHREGRNDDVDMNGSDIIHATG